MILFLLIALAVVALDRITKWLVIRYIPLGHEIPILGQWGLFTHIKNSGAAFGLFPGSVVPLIVISLVASIVLVAMAQRSRNLPSRLIPLGLILGGAVGNLIDRIVHKKVTDFILVGIPNGSRFPVFNVADSAVTIGVTILAIGIYFTGHPADKSPDAAPPLTALPDGPAGEAGAPATTGAEAASPASPASPATAAPPESPSPETPVDAFPGESH